MKLTQSHYQYLPRDAMRKRGTAYRPVYDRLSVTIVTAKEKVSYL